MAVNRHSKDPFYTYDTFSRNNSNISVTPNTLVFLTLAFSMVIVLANWFDPRLVNLFGLDTDAGTLVFPITYILSNIITEVYGYKHARRAIWAGFFFNAVFIIYAQLVTHMPSPTYPNQNAVFDEILSMNTRIIIASTISYLTAENLNAYLVAKFKIFFQGRYMAMRFVISTAIAAFLDSSLFGSLGFYGTMSQADLFDLIINMSLIKIAVEILCLPIATRFTKGVKRNEGIDTYDTDTDFTIFSIKTSG